jgi:hypothetical protein
MKFLTRIVPLMITAGMTLCLAAPAHASELIVNGGFESGLAAWTRADAAGSDGTFFLQTGTTSPVNNDPVPAPPGGVSAAMTDAQGPGSHVLYQDFIVPLLFSSATLDFDLLVNNHAEAFTTPAPASLDFSTPALNQQARVDILLGGTDPFSVAGADVLLNVFQTNPGDSFPLAYLAQSSDLSALFGAHAGETLRLRFAEVDNVFTFQLGVDNVSLTTADAQAVPEPASLLLIGTGLAALGARRFRRQS